MPAARPTHMLGGDRAEFLSQYLLSFIGLPLPVLRQLDIGIDMYCNISENQGRITTYSHPFAIQIKKYNPEKELLIAFGGVNKANIWIEHQIEWLYTHEIPFFIGIIDIEHNTLKIYSTSAIWLTTIYTSNKKPTEVILVPRLHSSDYGIEPAKGTIIDNYQAGTSDDGRSYRIDIGNPLIIIKINDYNDEGLIERYKAILKSQIDTIDGRNLIQRHLGSSFRWWNYSRESLKWLYNPYSHHVDISKMEKELVPLVISLAYQYSKIQSDQTKLNQLKPLINMIIQHIPPEIINQQDFAELFS